jgi:hypothetical protein
MGRQKGCIYKSRNGKRWLARWREFGKMRFRDLAPVGNTYRREEDVQPLLDEILRPLNAGRLKPEATAPVADYAENHWLPWVRENCKPSTIAGYERYWGTYLEARLKKLTLRDFRTFDASNILTDLHRAGHGRTMLKHCKAILSGISESGAGNNDPQEGCGAGGDSRGVVGGGDGDPPRGRGHAS